MIRSPLTGAWLIIAFAFLVPGLAPGSENWVQKERVAENKAVGTVVFNVVTSALTIYLYSECLRVLD